METGRWEVPEEVRSHFLAFGLSPRFTELKSKVHDRWSNSANWTEFLSFQMRNVSYLCSQKRASDQSPRSFNFTSTTTFELTFESLELIVSALLCVSLELTEGERELTAGVSTKGTQLCLILVFFVWLCPQNPLTALKLGKVTPVFLSHLPSLDEAKATAASAQHPNHRTPWRRHFSREARTAHRV